MQSYWFVKKPKAETTNKWIKTQFPVRWLMNVYNLIMYIFRIIVGKFNILTILQIYTHNLNLFLLRTASFTGVGSHLISMIDSWENMFFLSLFFFLFIYIYERRTIGLQYCHHFHIQGWGVGWVSTLKIKKVRIYLSWFGIKFIIPLRCFQNQEQQNNRQHHTQQHRNKFYPHLHQVSLNTKIRSPGCLVWSLSLYFALT